MNKARFLILYCMFTDVEKIFLLIMLLVEFDMKWLFPRFSKNFTLDRPFFVCGLDSFEFF